MSGGEKYMLSAALCLAEHADVDIFWDRASEQTMREKARERFGFDLSKISFVANIFTPQMPLWKRVQHSGQYDAIFLLSDGSLPLLGCPVYVHFQSPVEWVDGSSLRTKLKKSLIKGFICNSQFTKSYIDKKFSIKSKVIYPPVKIPTFSQPLNKENQILHVGRFGINAKGSSFKKQDVLAETFKTMLSQGLQGWKLVFVTSVMEQDRAALEEFRKAYKGLPIEFIVNPPSTKLWEAYEAAKIYWHASGYGEDLKAHPDRAEHFGISTVEAMGMGAVPVVINAGGQPEIVCSGETGFLWNTTEELIAQTKTLIAEPKHLQEMSERARKSADRFSQEAFCKALRTTIV
jgi:glycosyltransferase involved in cell wall biosynthesis